MKEITRKSAGVVFESDVLAFIARLAAEQQRNRSFIINAIIRLYARQLQQQTVQPQEVEHRRRSEIEFRTLPRREMMRINF